MLIVLQVRRFRCRNPQCPAVTFAEQAGGLSGRYRRRSVPLTAMLAGFGLELAGRAAEHYDFTSRHCVKDLTISRVQFSDDMAGLEIGLRHSCWKHEDDLVVRYQGVRELTAAFSYGSSNWTSDRQVILDEILPHDHGRSHEIACQSGSVRVVCRGLTATWIPALCPGKPAEPAPG